MNPRLPERARLLRLLPSPSRRRGLRLDAGYSLEDVAKAVGVSRMTVYRWESCRQSPRTVENLKAYKMVLETMGRVG